MILPASSWAQWAGLLSNATEIHVNNLPYHPIMPGMPQYIYHDEKKKQFFGRYNEVKKELVFELELNKINKTYTRSRPIIPVNSSIIPAVDLGSIIFTKVDKAIIVDNSRPESQTSTTNSTSTIPTLSPVLEGTFNISNIKIMDISNTS